MIRYLFVLMALFVYNSSAFDIVIDCKNVSGRTANSIHCLYDMNEFSKIKSTAKIECSDKGSGDLFTGFPKTIRLEDGDNFQWYDLYNLSYEAIRNQSETKEYIDTIRTDLNTFIRKVKWSGDDTTTYKIHISIDKD